MQTAFPLGKWFSMIYLVKKWMIIRRTQTKAQQKNISTQGKKRRLYICVTIMCLHEKCLIVRSKDALESAIFDCDCYTKQEDILSQER